MVLTTLLWTYKNNVGTLNNIKSVMPAPAQTVVMSTDTIYASIAILDITTVPTAYGNVLNQIYEQPKYNSIASTAIASPLNILDNSMKLLFLYRESIMSIMHWLPSQRP